MKSTRWLVLAALGAAGCSGVPDGAVPAEPTLTIDVAALNLAGVGDVVWDLEVVNGATTPETVWQRRLSSSGYGDGAGSASYVGTCDADANPNTVRVWVVGAFAAAVTDAGAFNRGSTADAGAVTGTPVPFENPTAEGTPLTRDVFCVANSDVAVQFDVALMRPAQQGFFDVAISFNNIFCSAKFDCCDDANANDTCDAGEDIALLFTPGAGRGRTMVLGFACTAGTGGSDATTLYMDALAFDCTAPADGFEADFTVSPGGAAAGNQCTAGDMAGCAVVSDPAPAEADTYLYQVAVYRGDELLQTGGGAAHKAYWNVALGVNATIGDCALRTRATADNPNDAFDGFVGGAVSDGAVYPYVDWDVALATCASEPLTFGATGAVRTRYSGTTAALPPFGYALAPGLPPADVDECLVVDNGGCAATATCTNIAGGRTCACPTGFSGDGLTCDDIDECQVDNGGCDPLATCANTVGGRACSCPSGFTGDGVTCAETNECLTDNGGCDPNATCTNTPGSFSCACDPGYSGDGISCTLLTGSLTVSASTQNYDVFTQAGAPTSPRRIYVTINAGVTVSSSSAATAAFRSGTLPAGSVIELTNAGTIIGAGGDAGRGGGVDTRYYPYSWAAGPGQAGGAAIQSSVPLIITNTGNLFGGGGGGGGGGEAHGVNKLAGGGGGGGGAGNGGGAGGLAGPGFSGAQYANGAPGAAGGATPGGGGAGGNYANIAFGGAGGGGGAYGQAGANGGTSNLGTVGGAGGAAGYAVRTDGAGVTWASGNTPTQVKGPQN